MKHSSQLSQSHFGQNGLEKRVRGLSVKVSSLKENVLIGGGGGSSGQRTLTETYASRVGLVF